MQQLTLGINGRDLSKNELSTIHSQMPRWQCVGGWQDDGDGFPTFFFSLWGEEDSKRADSSTLKARAGNSPNIKGVTQRAGITRLRTINDLLLKLAVGFSNLR